jgi:luciferase-like monooxygenase
MNYLKKIEDEISTWEKVSIYPHRFAGREFRFGAAEIGHIHTGGVVDIPLPRAIRDALLADGLAEEHRWVPDSGWITFRIGSEADLKHALWLMRMSYLRYALKTSTDPEGLLEQQSEKLHLTLQLKSLLKAFVPKTVKLFRSK